MRDGAPTPAEEQVAAKAPAGAAVFSGPVDIRSVALTALLVLAVFHTLIAARTLLLPVAFALLGNVALTPVVRWLAGRRLPEPLAAALILAALLGSAGFVGSLLLEPATEWTARLPASLRTLEWKLEPVREPLAAIGEAAERVEDAAQLTPETQASVEVRTTSLRALLLDQTGGFLSSLGLVLVLLYFLLASGENFLRKLVTELPRMRDKKLAVEVVREAEDDIARYFLTIAVVNVFLGAAVGLAMTLLDMPNPLLWGVMAMALNFVPYLGSLIGIGIITVASLLSFDELVRIAAVPAAYLALTVLEGSFLTPFLLGRRMLLSPVAVLGSLMFWTWVWGVAGAIVAVPILVAVKIACERVEGLQPVATLLGRAPRSLQQRPDPA